jgi:hypothetical protein
MLADPNWIPKSLSLLDEGYLEVRPEIQRVKLLGSAEPFVVARNVPLVMERSRFLGLGL